MAETKIQWASYTFNPWIGCTKVAPGCTNCYAEAFAKRYNKAVWGPRGTRVKTSTKYWQQPLRWNREAEAAGERRRVFCASLADVFEDWDGDIVDSQGRLLIPYGEDPDCPASTLSMDDLGRDLFALIDATPHLDWLLLTKRPENVLRMWTWHKVPGHVRQNEGDGYHRDYRANVWLGCSVSEQATADENIPKLLKCRDLCPVLFLSCEPLLSNINLEANRIGIRPWHSEPWLGGIAWVIIGGESGPHARPCHLRWIRDILQQCRDAGVAPFVKQLGANVYDDAEPSELAVAVAESMGGLNVSALRRLRLKDKKGGDMSEWDEDLRIREFPNVT